MISDFTSRLNFAKTNRLTALFDNTRTLKFKDQPTNVSFAAVNQVFWRVLPAYDYCRTLFVV